MTGRGRAAKTKNVLAAGVRKRRRVARTKNVLINAIVQLKAAIEDV
jgi:hypothetical protein